MPYEHKENSGSLFKNDKANEGNGWAPYQGSAKIGGIEYWVSAYVNKGLGSDAKKYFALKFKPKQVQPKAPYRSPIKDCPQADQGGADDGFDSDIPF